jgi:hypothetical protein
VTYADCGNLRASKREKKIKISHRLASGLLEMKFERKENPRGYFTFESARFPLPFRVYSPLPG